MSTLRKTAAGLGFVLILAGAGVFAFNRYETARTPSFTISPSAVGLACKPRQQLITTQYRDWLIIHTPPVDCKEDEVQVVYTNGETGIRHYRQDQTLESETIWTAAGDMRKMVKYGKDGKTFVEATENWLDGTPAWRLSVDDDGVITSTRYWPNGKVFSAEKTAGETTISDVTYYYDNGQQKAHFVGTPPSYSNNLIAGAEELDLWSDNGTLLLHVNKPTNSSEFTTYRADGTLWYVLTEQVMYWNSNPSTLVEYSADGKKIIRKMTLVGNYSPFYIDKIVEFLDDGTTWEYMFKSYSWELSLVRHWDKDRNNILEWKNTDPNFSVDRTMFTEPKFVNPVIEWDNMVDKFIYQSTPPTPR